MSGEIRPMTSEFFIKNVDGLHRVSSFVHDHFNKSDKALKLRITTCGKRSLSQNAFQHVIYQEISKYLVSKGREDWTPEFVKENMKNHFLGWDKKEYIDISSGCVSVREVLRKTSTLDKGESFNFTTQCLEWAESIGCNIRIPDDCAYRQMMDEQNGITNL